MFTPEPLHVALNHVALIGLPVAMIPLIIALLRMTSAHCSPDCGSSCYSSRLRNR